MKRLGAFLLFSLILAVGFAYAAKAAPSIPNLIGTWVDPAANHIYITAGGTPNTDTVNVQLEVTAQSGTGFVGLLTNTNPSGEVRIHKIAGEINPATKEVKFQAGYITPDSTLPTIFAIINGEGRLGTN